MRGDRIKCLGLRTYRTSCINATDSICRRARMESQSVVKLGQWARVDDKSNRSRSACGNATCGTFQHFQIAPSVAKPPAQMREFSIYGIAVKCYVNDTRVIQLANFFQVFFKNFNPRERTPPRGTLPRPPRL